jgi:hypothetical protein
MPQIALAKYSRSSFFASSASCEMLLSRMSTSLFTPARLGDSKNCRAVFFVKPMV